MNTQNEVAPEVPHELLMKEIETLKVENAVLKNAVLTESSMRHRADRQWDNRCSVQYIKRILELEEKLGINAELSLEVRIQKAMESCFAQATNIPHPTDKRYQDAPSLS